MRAISRKSKKPEANKKDYDQENKDYGVHKDNKDFGVKNEIDQILKRIAEKK